MDITRFDLMIEKGDFFFQIRYICWTHQECAQWRTPCSHHAGTALRWRRGTRHQNHLYDAVGYAWPKQRRGPHLLVTLAFMDGRALLPTNWRRVYLQQVATRPEYGVGKIATVNGRYYAWNRDKGGKWAVCILRKDWREQSLSRTHAELSSGECVRRTKAGR